jgi:hypothetical protein
MPTDTPLPTCRLCRAPLTVAEQPRQLCSVCDEYAQHVTLQSNHGFERVVSELQNGGVFVAASRNAH